MTMRREPVGIYPPSAAAAVLGLVLDVKRDFGASGSSESTTGSITAGSSVLTLASPIDFQNGQGISVAGAGASGALLVSTIDSGAGTTTLTLADAAGTTVSAATVQHDDTTAIQDAMAAGAWVVFPSGTYYMSSTANLEANMVLDLRGATFKLAAAITCFTCTVASVVAVGSGAFGANGLLGSMVAVNSGSTDFDWRADLSVSGGPAGGTAKAAFALYEAERTSIDAHIVTTDTPLVYANGVAGLSVSGVRGAYTSDPATEVIFVGDNISGNTMSDIAIADVDIDGGGVLTITPIVIGPDPGLNTGVRVSVLGVNVRNTTGGGDGVDIIRCQDITVRDAIFHNTNNGLSLVSSRASVAGVVADACRAPGVQVGDSGQDVSVDSVSVVGAVCVDCGSGTSSGNPGASGLAVIVPSGYTASNITFQGCISENKTGSTQAYGFGVGGGGSISDVTLIGNRLIGATAAILDSTGGAVFYRDNQGYNPVGALTAPAIPASGTAYTNAFGVDATVYVTGGTVTAIDVGGTATGMTSGPIRVAAGQTITLTYTSAPTWTWFGD